MASRRKGTVSKIGKSRYSYYIKLDGDDFYFNTKYNPKCGEGDVVGIEFDKKNEQRGQIKSVKILEDKGGPKGYQQPQNSGGGNSYNGGGNDDRQASIIYQSSRKDAIQAAGLIVSNEAIKLPKDADKRRTIIEALIDELTARYVKDASDPKNALKGEQEVAGDAAGGDDWEDDAEKESGDDWDDGWED